MELMTLNQVIVLAITNSLSGIFLGIGFALAFHHILKNLVPKWIKEVTDELKVNRAIEKAIEGRKNY